MCEEFRKANHDCLISVNANKYSVPYTYANKSVWIRITQGCKLKVFSQQARLIAQYTLSTDKGQIIINPEHYKGLRRRKISDKDLLLKLFRQSFPDKALFAEKLIAVQRMNAAHHLFRILDTLKYYSKEAVGRAIEKGLELNCFSSNIIIGILRAYHDIQMKDVTKLNITREIPHVNIQRDLSEYNNMEDDDYEE